MYKRTAPVTAMEGQGIKRRMVASGAERRVSKAIRTMAERAEDGASRAIREHERNLWDELNALLQAGVSTRLNVSVAQIAIAAALISDPHVKRFLDRIVARAFLGQGFLQERFKSGKVDG